MAAHSETCQSVGVSFVPMVVETVGGWDEEAVRTITAIGRSQGQRLGIPPSDYTTPVPAPCCLSLEGKRQHVDQSRSVASFSS